jgi:electron transport complex protein RnfG
MGRMMLGNGVRLWSFALVCALLVGLVYGLTNDRIATEKARAEAASLLDLIEGQPHNNDPWTDQVLLPDSGPLGFSAEVKGHFVRDNDIIQAIVVPAQTSKGYNGRIRMLVGVSRTGHVIGVRVTDHSETPGLGDQVDTRRSDWIRGFEAFSYQTPEKAWAVRKDGGQVDSFTGATITPRAVSNAVRQAVQYLQEHHNQLFREGTP